jgi:hypothetical protein
MVMFGVNALGHLGRVRLDGALMYGWDLGKPAMAMPQVPVAAHVQATDELALGLISGVTVSDWDTKLATVPLRFEALYAIPKGAMPIADVGVQAGFPAFLLPGVTAGDKVNTSTWTVLVSGTWWVDL